MSPNERATQAAIFVFMLAFAFIFSVAVLDASVGALVFVMALAIVGSAIGIWLASKVASRK
jgi:uncharacterized membrane protein YfcA